MPAGIVSSAAFEEFLPAATKLQQLQVGARAALWSSAAEDLESQTVQGPGESLHARHLTSACGRYILEPVHQSTDQCVDIGALQCSRDASQALLRFGALHF